VPTARTVVAQVNTAVPTVENSCDAKGHLGDKGLLRLQATAAFSICLAPELKKNRCLAPKSYHSNKGYKAILYSSCFQLTLFPPLSAAN